MTEIVVGLLGPIIELAKFIASPIKRQFNYLCCFNSNVHILDKEANKLEDVRDGVQREVDIFQRDAQVIDAQVKTWLDEVKEIQQKKSELDTEITNARGGDCLSVKSRYLASRRAVKTAAAMKQKGVERGNIPLIAHGPLPTSPAAVILERSVCDFESRAEIEEALTTMLKDESVSVVGICGMGGVGKTTMAEKIKNKLKRENIFGELVTAVVSQSLDKKKIQDQIAEQLDLKLEGKILFKRAERLCTRLMGEKRVLLVLDDVWEYLDLKEIGIPCKSGPKGCTILITSRDKKVLIGMDIAKQNILEVEVLSKEEAWSLFKEKLGTFAEDQYQLSSLAQEIVIECSGLPLALASVAVVLKGEEEIAVWRSALQQLRSGDPEDLPDVLEKVYTPLKLSYDYLKNKNAKSICLLCSLFPEDSNIDLQELTVIAMGLSMFGGIENLEPARDSVKALIAMLKHRSLLLEGQDEISVRMHDVVRDVAIFIASKAPEEKQLIKCGYQSTWISPFVGGERIKFSKESTFPNLRLLMIQDSKDEELHTMDISFEGMKELNVLFIKSNFSWTSLSLSQNLRTLVLVKCESLEAIFVVGDLWNLEILICRDCDAIKEFPSETVKSLKLLEISYCQALEKVGSAVLLPCSDESDSEQIKIKFPKLESLILKGLSNLRVFYQGIDSIEFPLLSHVKIKDCPQLEGLVSSSGETPTSNDGLVSSSGGIHMNNDDHGHSLHLFCKQKVSFGNLMKQLELRWATNCDKVFCSQISVGSFSLLEEFKIEEHQSIKSLFSFSIAQNLKSLKILMISDCEEMVKVIEEEEGECSHEIQHITVEFSKLESLVLENLPNLRVFYQGNASIKFPLLDRLSISRCSQLKGLVPSSDGISMSDDHSLHLICNQKVSFGTSMKHLELEDLNELNNLFCPQIPIGFFTHLEELHVCNCANNKILFSFSIAQNLDSLKKLEIHSLDEMEKVFEEAEEGCSHDTTLVFPHLEELSLIDLPRLKTFCNFALGFPKLVIVSVYNCPEIGGFNLGSLTTPNLESLESLKIRLCGQIMEQVFWWSEVENENSGICHSRHVNLRTLELGNLTRLTSIFKGVESIEFPLLTRVSIHLCPKLKSVVSATTCSNSEDINSEVVGRLKEQTFSMWHQIPIGSFTTLEDLTIFGCDEISSLFSSSIARNLINLKVLHIESSKEMVTVIEAEVEEYPHEITFLFPLLGQLWLSELPQLKSFCEWKCALELPLLKDVNIFRCPKMERFSLGSLTAPKLKFIVIDYEYITTADDLNDVVQQRFLRLQEKRKAEGDKEKDEIKEEVSIGNSMKRLVLNDLNNIFCPQIPTGSFTHLEELHVAGCANYKILYPFSIAQNLDSLKYLTIENCYEMEKVIEEAEEGCSHDTTLVFPHLEELTLTDLPKLKTFCNSALGFSKLVKLEIEYCPEMGGFNLGSLTTPILESLESVVILGCERIMEQVFWWSDVENENSGSSHSRHITFPNLRTLGLYELTSLTRVFKGVESIEFSHLAFVSIRDCPNLKSVVSTTTCSNSGDINNKEAVGKLKEQASSIWDQISIGSFTTLEDLNIEGVDVISSLFSSSIARKLINLKWLHIESCKKMVKVIEEEVDEYSHETTLFFPHLEYLELHDLPQLKSFCEWKCALELPLLESMEIDRCPKMERFSLGSVTAPKLDSIDIGYEYITTADDLNDVVQQRFLRLQDEASSDESEGDQKENDEIDEEEVELAFNEEDQKEDEIEKEDETGLGEGEGDQKKNDEIEEESKKKPTLSEGEGDKKEKDEIKEESPTLNDGERDQKENVEKK